MIACFLLETKLATTVLVGAGSVLAILYDAYPVGDGKVDFLV